MPSTVVIFFGPSAARQIGVAATETTAKEIMRNFMLELAPRGRPDSSVFFVRLNSSKKLGSPLHSVGSRLLSGRSQCSQSIQQFRNSYCEASFPPLPLRR